MDSDREELSVVGCRLSVREPCGSSNGQRTTDNGQQNLPPWQIVFPLHEGGGKLRDDTELRYALRALEAHFKEPFEVTIVGRKVPGWLRVESGERRAESGEKTGVRHIKAGGLKSSLVAAAAAYPDGFFWMYDDCCLLRDTTGRDMQVTPCKPVWSKAETPWGRQLRSIKTRLEKEGWAAARGFIRDYSCPHGPYWFDKGMVDEGFADWPGMAAKFPWESWILNKRGWPGREGVCVQYYAECRTVEPGDAFFLNYSDKGNTRELREWLGRRFAAAGRFETEEKKTEDRRKEGDLEVHTLRFGAPDWMRVCAPTLDAWCQRHGLPLRVWGDEFPQFPCAKFGVLDMLRAFLAGASTHFLYVDADVYVSPFAPCMDLGEGLFAARELKITCFLRE